MAPTMWVISPRKTHVFMIAKYQFYRFSQHFKRKKCDPLFNWLIETNNSVKIPFSNSYHYWISQWSLRQNSTLSPASVSSEVFWTYPLSTSASFISLGALSFSSSDLSLMAVWLRWTSTSGWTLSRTSSSTISQSVSFSWGCAGAQVI